MSTCLDNLGRQVTLGEHRIATHHLVRQVESSQHFGRGTDFVFFGQHIYLLENHARIDRIWGKCPKAAMGRHSIKDVLSLLPKSEIVW